MKSRQWDEEWPQRVLSTPDYPLFVEKGDAVLIVVAKSWEETADVLRDIATQLRSKRG